MVTLLLWAMLLPAHAGSWALPARAKVVISPAHLDTGYEDDPSRPCSSRRLSEMQIRRLFRTYHELVGNEGTQMYMFEGCVIEGEITVDGKSFHFVERPVNLLSTTWPDGEMHYLGGRHSDASSGK